MIKSEGKNYHQISVVLRSNVMDFYQAIFPWKKIDLTVRSLYCTLAFQSMMTLPPGTTMKNYLRSFNLLTEDEIDTIIVKSHRRTIRKDGFFIQEGRVCQEIAFVVSGFLRSFYQNSQGEEITYCFTFSNSFVTAYSSLIQQNTTFETIQAMTDVSLFYLSLEEIQRLEQTSVNWLKLSKMMAEMEYIKMEKRLILLLRENSEFRYRDLLENYPEYLKLIPLNHLASYLGITQRHLSRIRKSLTN